MQNLLNLSNAIADKIDETIAEADVDMRQNAIIMIQILNICFKDEMESETRALLTLSKALLQKLLKSLKELCKDMHDLKSILSRMNDIDVYMTAMQNL
jgi:hypothetical protein